MILLTNRQSEVLNLLAYGYRYVDIAHKLEITLACVHTHVSTLKKASGLRDPHNKVECLRLLGRTQPSDVRAGPTPRQLEILSLMAQGKPLNVIARQLMLSLGTVMNTASQGRKRLQMVLGISKSSCFAIKRILQMWEEKTGTPTETPTDPMF